MAFQEGIWIDLTNRDERQRAAIRAAVSRLLAENATGDEASRGWARALDIALSRLEAEGSHAQVAVIKEAAKSGGHISREQVYAVAQYSPERSLRGFTRAVRRVCEDLIEDDLLAEDAPTLLDTVYNDPESGYQQASGFMVPAEVVQLLADKGRRPQVGTDRQRARLWPKDDTPGITTARSRNVHKNEDCPKYQHTLDVSRRYNRKIHPVQRVTTGEARAAGKGICSHCFADEAASPAGLG